MFDDGKRSNELRGQIYIQSIVARAAVYLVALADNNDHISIRPRALLSQLQMSLSLLFFLLSGTTFQRICIDKYIAFRATKRTPLLPQLLVLRLYAMVVRDAI